MSSALISYGYVASKADHSLFVKFSGSAFTALLVYVDDILLIGNDLSKINTVKRNLDQLFKIKDLGVVRYFLGLEIARNSAGISVCQRKFVLDLLTETGYLDCKPASTPMDNKAKLSLNSGTPLSDSYSYRKLVGRLLYLTTTRPDIAFATQQLSQFLAAPTDVHLKGAHRVLRYLKSTPSKGLFFPSTSNFSLKGFSDSD